MTRRRVEVTPAPATTPATATAPSSIAASTMAPNTRQQDLLYLQRQIQHLTGLQEQARLDAEIGSARQFGMIPSSVAQPALVRQPSFTQQPFQSPAATNTLYDEWARNSPWEQAQAAAWYSTLPVRNAAGGLVPSGLAALGGGSSDEGKTEPESPEKYSKPFCDFLTENPTIFHAVKYFEEKLSKAGYEKVCALLPIPLSVSMAER